MPRPALGPAYSGYHSLEAKRLGREVDNSPLCSAEGRNVLLRFQIVAWLDT